MGDERRDTTAARDDRALPLDSDIEVDELPQGHPRPVHHHKRYLALVAAGGAVGTAAREGLTLTIAPLGSFPLPTFLINILGAFLLGLLLETLARRGPDLGTRRTLRLLLGTGALGGFTTYSTLATDSALLLVHRAPLIALGYAFGTVLIGALATWAGVLVAALSRPPRTLGADR